MAYSVAYWGDVALCLFCVLGRFSDFHHAGVEWCVTLLAFLPPSSTSPDDWRPSWECDWDGNDGVLFEGSPFKNPDSEVSCYSGASRMLHSPEIKSYQPPLFPLRLVLLLPLALPRRSRTLLSPSSSFSQVNGLKSIHPSSSLPLRLLPLNFLQSKICTRLSRCMKTWCRLVVLSGSQRSILLRRRTCVSTAKTGGSKLKQRTHASVLGPIPSMYTR